MASEFEQNLEKYAEVIVKIGLNVQPGQRLLIAGNTYTHGIPLEAAPLVRKVTRKAYEVGARFVDVIWKDEQLDLIRFQNAPRDSFTEASLWEPETKVKYAKNGDAMMIISTQTPDLFKDQDPELITTVQQTSIKNHNEISQYVQRNALNWLIVAAPIQGWADKVLPHIAPEARIEHMWDKVFEMCRIKNADPVGGWNQHIKNIQARADYMNRKRYSALKYAAPGTDLTVGLPAGHTWEGAGSPTEKGIFFTANIPTEEIFTLPHREQTQGVVTATKPLSFGGSMIENFSLTFEAGRIVKAVAEKGEVQLNQLLDMDEGARRIGEVALVPNSSPISQSGLLFYSILYDENASDHIALGRGYRFNLEGGAALTDDEFMAAGGNVSLIHVDFMIGSDKMNIDGVKDDGSVEPVMRNGEWAVAL
jgi:aminopeptidase